MDGTITPKLAESWEWVSDDHMVVHLRKGITFSNGNPLTAEDVLFTMERYREGGWAGVPRVQTTDFERTKIINDYTIDWYLNEPSVLHWTVPSDMLIFDKESFDEETAATNPIGTGPYVVTEYVVNSHIKMTRRDDYWGELPAIKDLTFRVLAEPSQRVNALETGLVDVVPIALADVEYVRSLPNYQVKSRPGQSWLAMGFNISQDGLLANPEARYAIMHAIDRQAICDVVYYGLAEVMNSPITKAALDYEDRFENMHDVYAIGYDLELAKELAEKTGLVGKTLRLINNGTAEHVAACEMVQNMLEKIGVTVEIHSYDPASFTDVQQDKNAYEISLRPGICPNLRVGDPMVNAIINNQIWKIPENWAYGNGPRYFELMRKSLSTLDDKERGDILYELLQYYIETSPTYAICSFDQFTAYTVDLDLSNYRERAIGSYYVYEFKFK
jgi:peptide/nickel transport system substrate-binding protein